MSAVKKMRSNYLLTIQESVIPSETWADQGGKRVTARAEAKTSEGKMAAVEETEAQYMQRGRTEISRCQGLGGILERRRKAAGRRGTNTMGAGSCIDKDS
jgi:hypothetical protein